MTFFFMSLFALLIAILDQFTKYLTAVNIPMYSNIPFLPGFLSFTHVPNYGGAWSALEGMRWFFIGVFVIITVLAVWEYFKKKLPFTLFERWCIAAICGGGLGNVIDRLRHGYVVDMIKTEFMDFPIFNVADCFITCGCIGLMLHVFFFNKAFWKDRKK